MEDIQTLVFISTGWGSKYGGINSFNTELCKSIPSILTNNFKVVCVCFEVDEHLLAEAKEQGISLFPIEKQRNEHEISQYILSLLLRNNFSNITWWFGHDVTTGYIAKACKESSKIGKLGIFHHMNFRSYAGYKHLSGEIVIDKSLQQKEVLSKADIILSIGPKLVESAKTLLIDTEFEKKIFQITPGLIDIKPSVQRQPFQAIVVGRLGNDDDIIKQFKLAVASFGLAIRQYPKAFSLDATMVLFGVPNDEADQTYKSLMELGHKYAGRVINIVAVPFTEKQSVITDYLRSSWACLMLSLHEGFGLAGWEAIAAEVPLIVSRNSGLFEYIRKEKGGVGTGCLYPVDIEGNLGDEHFSENDLKNVSSALVAIGLRNEEAKRDAQLLRANFETCTWQQTAMELATTCSLGSIYIAGENPGEFVQKLLKNKGAFDEHVSKRTIHFGQIFNNLRERPNKISRVILFGGISTMLRDEDAIKNYAVWLINNNIAKLFICYESGKSAETRAYSLDEKQLDSQDNLPANPLERMKTKEKKVIELKEKINEFLGPGITRRIYFIPLGIPLTNYTMICGHDMYVAPVLHGRSSNTESIRLPSHPSPYRDQFLDYMMYHAKSCKDKDEITILIDEIEKVKNFS